MIKSFFFLEVLKEYFLILIYKTNIFIKLLKQQMMIYINFILPLIIIISGLTIFLSNQKHLLIILLRLEFIVLGLFLILFIFLKLFNYEIYFLIIFLIFSVCEGVLGLSILVSIIRTHGNNYFQSLNILLC